MRETRRPIRRAVGAPAIADLIAVFVLLVVPLGGALDPRDTPAHLRVGTEILREGRIPRVEQFSYTRAGEPLVLSGWLSDVLLALAARVGGLEAVVLLVSVVLAATYGLLALLLRRREVDARIALLAVLFAAFLGIPGWSARPHLFSYLGVAILLHLLERSGRATAWPYALLFLAWANLHAGFVYGLLLMGVYWVGALLESRWGGAAWEGRARDHLRGLAAGLLATLVTPFGPRLHTQIVDTLGDPRLLDRVGEYARSDPWQPEGAALYAAAAATALALALLPRRPAAPALLAILAFLCLALLGRRHVPLFGIVALPLLALSMRGLRRRGGYLIGDHLARRDPHTTPGPWAGATLLLVGGLLYSGGGAAERLARFDPRSLPVEAVQRAREAGLAGRVFHDPNWGGYLLHAWPERRLFLHPLRYDLELVESALRIERAEPGWREELDRHGVSIALLAPSSPLAAKLEAAPGWATWHRDDTAVVFRRTSPLPPSP